MSTEERDTAQRCDRCQRMTLGTARVRWITYTGELGEHVARDWRLCTRCRGEVSSHIQHMIREAVTW